MSMIHLDEDFECQNCHFLVSKRGGGYCRNHCPKCLYSLHVDLNLPGDRQSTCFGLMKPIDVILNTKKRNYQLIQQCLKCKYQHAVTVAKDDDMNLILHIARESAENKSAVL